MIGDILLLGGGGFIGQALARRLAETGHAVTILARHSPRQDIPGVTWRQGRLEDVQLLADLLFTSTAVVHLATTSTPGSNRNEAVREAQENLLPILGLLELMEGHRHIPLIYMSTGGAIYGNTGGLPVREVHQPMPISYHAAGKAAAEHFLAAFAYKGHKVTILRPANAYGPGQPLKRDFGVVRTLLEHIKQGTTMEIWGDGETVRDYLFIEDLTEALIRVLKQPVSGTFNLGSGVGHSLNTLCRLAQEITGRRLDIHYRSARSQDVKAIVLDNTAFRHQFDWLPRVALEEGLEKSWRWLQGQK